MGILTSISKFFSGMQRKIGLCVVIAWHKTTLQKCHAFTTQSPTFRSIPEKNLLIEVNPHIWFQQRFLISGRNSTTLFSVVKHRSFWSKTLRLTVLFYLWLAAR